MLRKIFSTGLEKILNICHKNLEDDSQHFRSGPLYRGPQAVCLQRWGFWQTRFEELGENFSLKGEIRKEALKAAETMKTVERNIGHSL
jgi:hypothetical protein